MRSATDSPKDRLRSRGYLLLPVTLLLAVVAAAGYWLSIESAMGSRSVAAAAETDELAYLLESGEANARWQIRRKSCVGTVTLDPFSLASGGVTSNVAASATTTISTFDSSRDAWIEKNKPTSNKGTDVQNGIDLGNGNEKQSLYHFDISSLSPGSQIQSATAYFVIRTLHDHEAGSIRVHRVLADWAENSVTWDSFADQYDTLPIALISPQDTEGATVAVNLTGQVQAWVNGQENFGILLRSPDEGFDTHYGSKEATAAERPYLEVVVGSGNAADASVQMTATLANGNSRSNQVAMTATHPPGRSQQRKIQDTYLYEDDWNDNFGGSAILRARHGGGSLERRPLMIFDMSRVPAGAEIASATLSLFGFDNKTTGAGGQINVYRMTTDWEVGTNDGAVGTGASWTRKNASADWGIFGFGAGGIYSPTAITSTDIPAGTNDLWHDFDLTQLARDWADGRVTNQGLILISQGSDTEIDFRSADHTDYTQRPKFTVQYVCECGSTCHASSGSGAILFVVKNDSFPDAADSARRSLFENWGYTVTLKDDSDSQSSFDSDFGSHDVVYVSSTAVASTLGQKLRNAPIGVVTEDFETFGDLGIASSGSRSVGSDLAVIDSSHFITQPFAATTHALYDAPMYLNRVSGSAPVGLQVLAQDAGGSPSLAVMDAGIALGGGGNAAAPRVFLPALGADQIDGSRARPIVTVLIERALHWSKGSGTVEPADPILFATSGDGSIGGLDYKREDLVLYDPDTDSATLFLDGAAVGITENIVAVHRLSDERLVFAFGGAVELGGQTVEQGDLVVYDPAVDSATVLLDSSQRYSSGSPEIASVHITSSGTLLLTHRSGNKLGGLSYDASDVIEYDRITDSATMLLDASSVGLDKIVSSLHRLGDGRLVLSSISNATLGGVSFTPDDLVAYDIASDTASLYFDGSAFRINEDLSAVHVGGASGEILSPEPAGHWEFEEGAGTVAKDSSSYAWQGTLGGDEDPTYTTGRIGDWALDFTGDFDEVEIPDAPDGHLDFGSDDFAVSLWVNSSHSITGSTRLVGKLETPADPGWVLFFNPGGSLDFMVSDGSASPFVSYTGLLDGNWHYVVGRKFGNEIALFIDGVEVSTTTETLGSIDNSTSVILGVSFTEFDGLIDDFRLFDGPLMSEDIALFAAVPAPGSGGGGASDLPPSGSKTCAVGDDFESGDYKGNTGSIQWLDDWAEVNESDGPSQGDEQVVKSEGPTGLYAQIKDNDSGGEGIERVVDLSGQFSQATLTLEYWRDGLDNANDYVQILISDNGSDWKELGRISGGGSDDLTKAGTGLKFDVHSALSSKTHLRFLTSPKMGGADEVYLDNIQIELLGDGCP